MRRDVEFLSAGTTCRGWLYEPDGAAMPNGRPAVVLAHGFSCVKEMALPTVGERLAAHGIVALAFDYRFLGASDGTPRGRVIPYEQQEDIRNAVTWLGHQPGVDAARLGLWGTSYGGGHALRVGPVDPRVRTVVAQVPAVTPGWRRALVDDAERRNLDRLLATLAARRDAAFDTGEQPMMAVSTADGRCLFPHPGAVTWFAQVTGDPSTTWVNAVTMDSVEQSMEYDPAAALGLMAPKPLLVVAALHDEVIPIEQTRLAVARAGGCAELVELDCRHFEVYGPGPWCDRAVDEAVAWFRRHLATDAA